MYEKGKWNEFGKQKRMKIETEGYIEQRKVERSYSGRIEREEYEMEKKLPN